MLSLARVPDEFLNNWTPIRSAAATATSSSSSGGGTTATSRSSTPRKVCTACDSCRQARVKCNGDNDATCQRCHNSGSHCNYSTSMRSGRVKATRARNTVSKALVSSASRQKRVNHSQDPTDLNLGQPGDNDATLKGNNNSNVASYQGDVATNGAQDYFSIDQPANFSLPTLPPPTSPTFAGMPSLNMQSDMGFFLSTSPTLLSALSKGPTLALAGMSSEAETVPNLSSPTSSPFRMPSLELEGDLDFSPSSLPAAIPSLNNYAPTSVSSGANCCCLKTQIHCIAELCNPQEDLSSIGLDAILQTTRETSKHISSFLSCSDCAKESTNFVFTAILFQRLVNLFCNVAKNGSIYLKTMTLGGGIFQLSEEEDLRHKRLLVASAAKNIDLILSEMGDTIGEYQQKELLKRTLGETTTETGRLNLKWMFDTMRNLKSRLRLIVNMLEAHDWGSDAQG
jgi:hypothetical protein